MPIDTHIDADAGSCRQTAQWLTTVQRGAHDAATDINAARISSEDCWRGAAGDTFRGRASQLRTTGDDISTEAGTGARALDGFAASVDAVKATMEQARQIATRAGLPVSGETIGDPLAAPSAPPAGAPPPTPQQATAHRQAAATATAQQAAYDQASTLAGNARARYVEAQETLKADLRPAESSLAGVANTVQTAVRNSLAGLYGAATKWTGLAGKLDNSAAMWRQVSRMPGLNPAAAADAFEDALGYQARAFRAADISTSNRRLLLGLDRTRAGGFLLNTLTAHPGQHLPATGVLSKAAPVLRYTPYVGLLAVGGGIGKDIHDGMPVGQAVTRNAVPYAAGTAAGAGVTAVAAWAAPVALAGGPATLIGVGVGIGVAYGVGYAIDHWDSVENAAGEAADWAGDGLEDAGSAIKKGWNSVF